MTKIRQWSILTVVAVIIVFAAGWFLMVKPQKSKATDLRAQAQSAQQANQVLAAQIASLQQQEKDLPQQQAALRKFATQVPDNPAEPTIIRQLSAAANGAGVDLVSMTPGEATPVTSAAAATTSSSTLSPTSAPLVGLPISIAITGTYPNVESFFQSLEKLPRALLVTGWALCPMNADAGGSGSSGGAGCTVPSVPSGKSIPQDALGGTLSAEVFYSAATAPATGTSLSTTTTSTTTTTPSTTTTPAPGASTAATPASNATPAATSAPAN
jgi:Tfp pilus assembly protein PilO